MVVQNLLHEILQDIQHSHVLFLLSSIAVFCISGNSHSRGIPTHHLCDTSLYLKQPVCRKVTQQALLLFSINAQSVEKLSRIALMCSDMNSAVRAVPLKPVHHQADSVQTRKARHISAAFVLEPSLDREIFQISDKQLIWL
jgi:hypothetical protein